MRRIRPALDYWRSGAAKPWTNSGEGASHVWESPQSTHLSQQVLARPVQLGRDGLHRQVGTVLSAKEVCDPLGVRAARVRQTFEDAFAVDQAPVGKESESLGHLGSEGYEHRFGSARTSSTKWVISCSRSSGWRSMFGVPL